MFDLDLDLDLVVVGVAARFSRFCDERDAAALAASAACWANLAQSEADIAWPG